MQTLFCLLPILAAVLIESHIRLMSFHSDSAGDLLGVFLQLTIEALPLYLSHYFLCQRNTITQRYLIKLKRFAILFWLLGFIVYPALLLSFGSQPFSHFSIFQTPLFSVQLWLIALSFSVIWLLTQQRQSAVSGKFSKWLSWCFSLNALVSFGIVMWAVIMAGILNSNENPMENQPLTPLIDVGAIFSSPLQFIHYFWQFLFLGGLVGIIYLMNRYWFIRRFLAEKGVLAFLMVSICCLVIVTPLFSYFGLLIPLNQYEFTLIPSADHNPFEISNYHFMTLVLAISTPVILAFERQEQQLKLSKIESSKRLTELKLLQQQINPHFLFNTLNNLYALTLAKSEQAPDMVMKLSNLLRYTVYEGQNDTVTIEQEVEYLKDFIALQKIRLPDETELSVQWPSVDIDSVTNIRAAIPPLLLINIVENAFKYAVKGIARETIINIELRCDNKKLVLFCENSIDLKGTNTKGDKRTKGTDIGNNGVGLENLKRRLKLLYPDGHQLVSQQKHSLWQTTLTIELKKLYLNKKVDSNTSSNASSSIDNKTTVGLSNIDPKLNESNV